MSKPHIFIFLFILSLAPYSWSQSSEKYSSEYAPFYRAEDLFEKEQYSAARKEFSDFIQNFNYPEDPQYIKARYYHGLSALHLYNRDAVQLLMEFVNDYPESIYRNGIYHKIGNHYYQRKKYDDARIWLEKTDPTEIDTSKIAGYHFKLGYSYFQLGEYSKARNEFFEVKDGNSNFSAPALYYYSHIAYQNKTYQEALEGFLKLKENPTFKDEVMYYITQIYYLLEDYDKVTEIIPQINVEEITKNTPEMNLLIGDAFYRVQKYDEAVIYLANYYERKQTTREQNYSLGYSYFKSEHYQKAIALFDRVTNTEDKLGQVSYYHIAQCYLAEEELNYARTAFKSASEYDFDAEVQEDALYNYAVLSYKLDYNPYNEAIKAFELFLQEFPESDRKESVYSYLVNVYSSTKKYREALNSLDRIPDLNIKLKTAYQVISYNMGIEKYERGDYKGSVAALKKVNKYDIDPAITGKANFWEADAHYMLEEWEKAIQEYRAFLAIPGVNDKKLKEMAYYNIAYAYFEQEDWTQAIQAFRTFTQLPNNKSKTKLADAYVRIGDGYYTKENPDFEKAANQYNKALEFDGESEDRTLYSLARVYGFLPNKRQARISTLQDIINNHTGSSYVIPSIYDIGISYKNEDNLKKSEQYFEQIVKDYPNNILVKDALIEIANIKYKQKKYEESESYFRRVLTEYSLDDETCKEATQGIIDIYRETRQQDKITKLSNEFLCVDISTDDEEVFFYETANELYLNEKYKEAIPELEKYLKRYPEGRFSIQLMSYLADIYYQREDKEQAIIYYKKIINRPASEYTTEALVRTSKTLYNNEEFEKALPFYQKLEKLASKPQIIYNTRVGLMRTNYLLEYYDQAAKAAENVVKDKLLEDQRVKIEAHYIAGMSFSQEQEYQESLEYLRWTAEHTGKVRGTEALFTLTHSYYKLEDYTKAEELHNELLKRKPAYDFWIAKSLILQARVFMAKGDLFQAEKTVKLVIANYPNDEDGVKAEAEEVKAEIMQLKDTPKNDEDDSNRTIDLNNENDE